MITSSPFSNFVTPIKALWRWLMVEPGHVAAPDRSPAQPHQFASGVPVPTARPGDSIEGQMTLGKHGVRRMPVRVVQVLEAGQTHAQAGRLRISGRMADVCAELDRLAAREALLH